LLASSSGTSSTVIITIQHNGSITSRRRISIAMIAFFAAPPFHEGSGSAWARVCVPAASQARDTNTNQGARRRETLNVMTFSVMCSRRFPT
jgi:hypothetical protein